ncbi:hypothetical protein AHMF7605_26190 [Adhaeribacter arboris]|uniref:Uncharacterized protein n=1 Tax=Adhaeribacter arboris TaxID=2072846 RepID=A0A2T2YMM7_9BACT|nr:helix-turn-helix domain-containing protein [Adhaeribacter arboris]PSR56736.1 hypothetical protein AHMF7605_26190 [Adhaeribacter arboris]
MTANDLLTVGHLNDFKLEIKGMLDGLKPVLANSQDRYLTIQEIIDFTGHSDKTVRSWIKEGKKDRFGKVYKLEAEQFSPSNYRVLRSTLIAFGKIKGCIPAGPKKTINKSG